MSFYEISVKYAREFLPDVKKTVRMGKVKKNVATR